MKIAIIGGSQTTTFDFSKVEYRVSQLITGNNNGVETLAEEHYESQGVPVTSFETVFKAPLSNYNEIIDMADAVVIVVDYPGPVTHYAEQRCRNSGKPHQVIETRTKKTFREKLRFDDSHTDASGNYFSDSDF